jgi:aldose 1-epimerase
LVRSGDIAHLNMISSVPFGATPSGEEVQLYTLRNRTGMEARIMTYGGIVTTLTAPDREGHFADVVLGYDSLQGYLKDSPYFGALIGRYGNRIAKGQFILNGKTYQLATNDGPNSLHGGNVGFDKAVWKVAECEMTADGPKLALSYVSVDGEEGYPGTLSVRVAYTLGNNNELRLDYTATTTQPTVVNLTQHSYFNLRGHGACPRGNCPLGDILGHVVQIDADRFTPVDSTLIPSGELKSVVGTPFDFRRPTPIGARIEADDEQLMNGKGYDHNWVINRTKPGVARQAIVYEPDTGRVLEIYSTEPGVQFYSGNFLDGALAGKGGWVYKFRSGFCLEPQHFPDSPNKPHFPSTVLRPDGIYESTIIIRFSARLLEDAAQ